MSKKENTDNKKENKKAIFIRTLWRIGGLGLAAIGIIGLTICSIGE
ncbi:MAG: hypothetical protein ACTSX1_11380 [Candidatus Heimdallarchaeaceae archaeon]